MLSQLTRHSTGGQRAGYDGHEAARADRGSWPRRGHRPAHVRAPEALSRRAVIKGHFHQMGDYGLKAARLHLEYIQRDGVGQDGEPGALYNRDQRVAAQDFGEALPNEPRQFRFIVAPEDGKEVDLTLFTRRLMAQVELDLGRRVRWVASNHHDTDNPHVHLVLRGVDEAGAELRIDPDYIKQGFRNRAREILSEELGPRTAHELDRQLDREVAQQRFTSLDRDIAKRVSAGKLDLSALHRERYLAPRLVSRLRTLEALGLARPQGGPHWAMADGWDTTLRRLGTQHDIVKRLHERVPMESSRYREFPDPERSSEESIEGIVRHKGLHDELRGTIFLAVETLDGRVHYLQAPPRTAERRVGELVRVEAKPPADPSSRFPRLMVHGIGSQTIDEQIRYRGPTWLDGLRDADCTGATPFATAVADARRARSEFVSGTLALDPRAPQTRGRLRALERAALGAELARSTGGRYLGSVPATFRGRLQRLNTALPSGQLVTIVRNEESSDFAVLARAANHRAVDGQLVELTREGQGQIAVRQVTRGPER